MKKPVKSRKVLLAMPETLLKKLDVAARKEQRSRTAEVCVRLLGSFKAPSATQGSGPAEASP